MTTLFIIVVAASLGVLTLAVSFLFAWVLQLERGLQDAHARCLDLEDHTGMDPSKRHSRRRDD